MVCTTEVRDEGFRNGKIYKDKAQCLLPPPKSMVGLFSLKKFFMGEQTFLGKFMGGLFYIGSNDQIIQGGWKIFTNAFSSNLNSENFPRPWWETHL